MKLKKIFHGALALAILTSLSSCEEYFPAEDIDDENITTMEYSFDMVKLIDSTVTRPSDDKTFEEDAYVVSPTSRLMLSLSHLSDHTDKISVSRNRKVWAQVTLVDGAFHDSAVATLKLCPMNRPWMMLATWNQAHPFGRNGRWSQSGGDFVDNLCRSPSLTPPAAPNSSGTISSTDPKKTDLDPRKIYFDVTDWYKNYVIGRSSNHGLLLMSSEGITLEGDTTISDSPRMVWSE